MGFGLRNYFWVVALVIFLAVAAGVPAGAVTAPANASNGSFGMQWQAGEEEEWALDSETSRRILQSTTSISYKALRSGMPAGSARSGLSYRRGCQRIYGCKGGY
ncbi:uncharacterized protein LOC120110692 [Phoenix dactylifera]|uniref:Uncharacterized protein LOC120110692 n=1 Tax=Phoenix dactylifera TaxID=42345 RepID=A0A8B9A920_PHODC|nr:uncharacterized protein LOC120110692 [Phoenix dactylifera]